MDLPDFLLARISEDEAYCRVKLRLEGEPGDTRPDSGDLAGFLQRLVEMCGGDPEAELMAQQVKAGMRSPTDPVRLLAELDAKRQMVQRLTDPAGNGDPAVRDAGLSLLAAPYATHPDFRREWAH